MGFKKKFKKSGGSLTAYTGKNNSTPIADKAGLYNPQELWNGLSGKAQEKAASEAQGLQEAFARDAIALQRQQFDDSYDRNKPYYEAGARQLGKLEEGATTEGLSSNLQRIMQENAVGDIRNQAIADSAQGMGLRRDVSGMGDLEASEAVTLEDMLNQRKQSLAGKALSSAGDIGGIGQATANNISNTLSGLGASNFNSIMAQNAARQQGLANIGNLGAGAYDYFRGGNSGGGSFSFGAAQPFSYGSNAGATDLGSDYSGQMPA